MRLSALGDEFRSFVVGFRKRIRSKMHADWILKDSASCGEPGLRSAVLRKVGNCCTGLWCLPRCGCIAGFPDSALASRDGLATRKRVVVGSGS